MSDTYSTLLIERHADGYAVVTLNRPEALNALNSALFTDLATFLDAVEHDDSVRCLILTGAGDKAFAAGADIKEMQDQTYAQMYTGNFFALGHDRITRFRKPVIAAVNGFALGGGCELAMLCDFIVASEKATMKSHSMASSQPPPKAKPLTAAIIGLRKRVMRSWPRAKKLPAYIWA